MGLVVKDRNGNPKFESTKDTMLEALVEARDRGWSLVEIAAEQADLFREGMGIDLPKLELYHADFAQSNLMYARIRQCNVEGAKFTRANLGSANFDGCIGSHLDISQSFATNLRMRGAVARRMLAVRAELDYADFSGSKLPVAKFQGANLGHARFVGCDLSSSSFLGAKLHGANFTGADLDGCDFAGCDLHGAIFHRCKMSGCDFTGARFSYETQITKSRLAWSSHDLMSHILQQASEGGQPWGAHEANLKRKLLAGHVLVERDRCWGFFIPRWEQFDKATIEWALRTFLDHRSRRDNGFPVMARATYQRLHNDRIKAEREAAAATHPNS